MKKFILSAFGFVLGAKAFASGETKKLVTPRGAELEVTVHAAAAANSPIIIVAPGKSCNSKGPLFESIGKNGPISGFNVVRFEWAYCLKDAANPTPSPELKNEAEDYATVLNYAQTLPSVDVNKILIAGKSLGSIVAYATFRSTPAAKALALLTPVCSYTTDDNGNPVPEPLRVCDQSYPGMKTDSRPILMAMGDKDKLCILNILFDYLKDSAGNIAVNVAGGDHGFRLKNADGTADVPRTDKNLETVVGNLLNWADQKMNP